MNTGRPVPPPWGTRGALPPAKDMSAGQLRSALHRLEGQRREAWRKYYAMEKKYNELKQKYEPDNHKDDDKDVKKEKEEEDELNSKKKTS